MQTTTPTPSTTPVPPLLRYLPRSPDAEPDADALLEGFLDYCEELGLELYDAQEEAILEVFAGNNVVLSTPTGSGKSMVALAGHFASIARGERSFYTAPVKALVSEKFFSLCRDLGSDNVGMLTGDAAVNADAPVVCCTAEILANMALRHGDDTPVDHICMDEFHYYADRDRGWAWQVPILELSHPAFLVMSATLGDTSSLEEELTRRTGRRTALVRSDERPVPLDFAYRETPLHESIEELVESDRAPVYIVHFTQKAATERAQALTSMKLLTRDEKALVRDAVGRFRFDTPFGKDLKRFIGHGVGVHHAGLLPKYRLLVERLAQQGLLKVICGTDTLGVGVNVPIRTVLFTQLCKYDGEETRVLTVRDFKQIAGRAGRKGFDDRGYVWVQAPEHVVENKRALAKAGDDNKKKRKIVRKKEPERGYKHWNHDTMRRLVGGDPETLTSSFAVSHAMLLELLDRPGDGCAAVKRILTENHDPRPEQRNHIRRAIAIYRSLLDSGVVETLDEPDDDGRRVRIGLDLQEDFSLNQPLSPFVLDFVGALDHDDLEYPLHVMTVVESVLENPRPVLARQADRARSQALAEMKAEGVPYEERIEVLQEITWPKPLAEALYGRFDEFRLEHPWAASENVRPKTVARDMFELGLTFTDYVTEYGLRGSEGVLLRYLSDAYKGLVQNVPEDDKTEELFDVTDWLGEVVRAVDSSLLDEWERLRHPEELSVGEAAGKDAEPERFDVTANRRAFRVMVRNEMFRWVQLMGRRGWDDLGEILAEHGDETTATELEEALTPYWGEHGEIRTDSDARGPQWFDLQETGNRWPVRQNLLDPDGEGDWAITAAVDVPASREAGRPVVHFGSVGRIGGF